MRYLAAALILMFFTGLALGLTVQIGHLLLMVTDSAMRLGLLLAAIPVVVSIVAASVSMAGEIVRGE